MGDTTAARPAPSPRQIHHIPKCLSVNGGFDMNETDIVYRAKLEAKKRIIAKYGAKPKVLSTITAVAGV
jgi:hypothetical protein